MAVIVRGGGDFTPAPEGLHAAVCVDVVDLGLVETQWGEKHMVTLVWEVGAVMDDGRPCTVRKRYTASLHKKSTLFKDLSAWRGRPFTAEELSGFDLEKILGAPCQLLVQHAEREGSIYANVAAVMKAAPGQKLAPSGTYQRVQDRPDAQHAANGRAGSRLPGDEESEPLAEEPIPF